MTTRCARTRFSTRLLLVLLCAATASPGADFYCDPAAGSPAGDGNASRPWGSLQDVLAAGKIRLRGRDGRVANPDAPVKDGDTVWLKSGWHGNLKIASGFNDEFVTIAAATGSTPQVAFVDIGEGRRWKVKGLTVSPSLAPQPLPRPPSSLVSLGERGGDGNAELVVEDCFVFSELESSGWSAQDWVRRPRSGIWLGRHGTGHVARNNYILNTRFGINLCAPGSLCEGNVVDRFSADGIRVTRDGCVVQYNAIRNNFVGAADGDDNHDDGIQAFLFNAGTGTLRDVVVRGNLVVARERDDLPFPNPLQGIGFFDGPLVNFLVEKNVVLVNHHHGISLYDAQGCRILDNACRTRWTDGRLLPWIMLGQKKKQAGGNTVRGNLAHSFGFKADATVTESDNRLVTPELFAERHEACRRAIEERFGRTHGAAGRPRIPENSGH